MNRKPSQPRSIATVEAILQAGEIVLAQEGLDAMSTRRVAEVAGVGVGSLYEYFENKEAIEQAVTQRYTQQIAEHIESQIPSIVRMPLRDAIIKVTNEAGNILAQNNNRILNGLRNSMGRSRGYPFKPMRVVLAKLSIQYFMQHPDLAHAKDLPTVGYITIYSGMYTLVHHLSDPNPPMSFEELTNGLADMISLYMGSKMPEAAQT